MGRLSIALDKSLSTAAVCFLATRLLFNSTINLVQHARMKNVFCRHIKSQTSPYWEMEIVEAL